MIEHLGNSEAVDPNTPSFEPDEGLPDMIPVFLNAGFGRRSHVSILQSDGTITLPMGLVRELNLEPHDDIEWKLDTDTGIIYIKVIHKDWQAPDWLDAPEEQQ